MQKLEQLQQHLASLGPIAIAVSGGVDSEQIGRLFYFFNEGLGCELGQ